MLEIQHGLATWALQKAPDAAPEIAAEALPDHRLAYLEYEGPIADGRGTVTRWDRGTYQLDHYERDEVTAIVAGETLLGEVALRRSSDDPSLWTFRYVAYA
jgi:hypothetical protein